MSVSLRIGRREAFEAKENSGTTATRSGSSPHAHGTGSVSSTAAFSEGSGSYSYSYSYSETRSGSDTSTTASTDTVAGGANLKRRQPAVVPAATERLLGVTPRARETKAPVPLKLLYQQHEKSGRREKAAFYRRAKRVRVKIVRALLAHRNDDPTDAERAAKRRRREELRIDDRVQRQVLRDSRSAALTKEEREEKRKRIMVAKQERIAKNRERKRRLHEHRERAFQRWREQKLATAANQEV